MMITLGYICAIFIGFVLGLLGAGGSILSVPIFVYLFNIPAAIATGYSLFIVGSLAIFGAITYYRRDHIDIKTALFFAAPSMVGVYISRRWIVPSVPDIMTILSINITKDQLLLTVFALLMLVAAMFMIRKPVSLPPKNIPPKPSYLLWFILQSLLVGLLTGFVGAGGGFMIIPALVLFKKLDMKVAIGTSLLIVAINSIIGFIGDIQINAAIDWAFLFTFWGLAILGLMGGAFTSKFVSSAKLKPAFGYFVLLVAVGMLCKELFL